MKKWFDKRVCLCFVLILALGIFPANVLAEETSDSLNNNAVNSDNPGTVVEARQMLPGDYATDNSGIEDNSDNNQLGVSSIFTPRFTAPGSDNDNYFANNIFYQSGYGMPNCTAYAWGRAYEILGSKPNLSNGNANQFWDYNLSRGAYSYGSTPKLGAIVCWNGSECGHVAVVEEISGNRVTISESAWSGPYFKTMSYTVGSENSTSVGGFQGYIYIGDFDNNPGDTVSPVISNARVTNIDDEGFTVTCDVSDASSGIDRVLLPTWTDAGGQDDLVWHQATVSGNTATYRVRYQDHKNEMGAYTVHVYAYDRSGNSSGYSLNVIAQKNISCSYQTHVQDFGWQFWKTDGELSGTLGEAKRLEAIEVRVDNKGYDVGVEYRTHIESIGWQDWKQNGVISGTSNRGLRLEAIEAKLTGADANKFDLYYRVHAENIGWLDWAKNGGSSGTAGFGYRLEAIEIQVLPAGSPAPGSTIRAFASNN